MNTPLLSNGVGELSYSDIIPTSLLTYRKKAAVPKAVSGPFGDFLFQEIATPDAVVWYNNYRLLQNGHFINRGERPKIELQFILNNSFSYHAEGIGRRELRDGSFNLLYVPMVNNEVALRSGRHYTTFDIYLSPLLIRKLLHFFPILGDFLERVSLRKSATLCPVNQLTTVPMSKIIDEILDNKFENGAHAFYVGTKVTELLLAVLSKVTSHPVLRQVYFHQEEIQLIYAAKNELLKNLDQPMTLLTLSKKVGLNRHKLKCGFREFYGCTITAYRLEARMKEARRQLLNTFNTIEEVGYNVGYSNAQHFSKAYKKYHGHTPARERKDRENERIDIK